MTLSKSQFYFLFLSPVSSVRWLCRAVRVAWMNAVLLASASSFTDVAAVLHLFFSCMLVEFIVMLGF